MTLRQKRLERMAHPETKCSSKASLPSSSLYNSHVHPLSLFSLSFFHSLPIEQQGCCCLSKLYPWPEGNNISTLCSPEYLLETQSGPLIPYILFLCFLSFFFLSLLFFLANRRGQLKQARGKGWLLSVMFFSHSQFFLPVMSVNTNTCFLLMKWNKRGQSERDTLTNDIIIDCKLRSISLEHSHHFIFVINSCHRYLRQ